MARESATPASGFLGARRFLTAGQTKYITNRHSLLVNTLRPLRTVKHLQIRTHRAHNDRQQSGLQLSLRSFFHENVRAPLHPSLFCVLLVNAQGFGQFVGTVTDPTGAVIANAKVTATESGTALTRTVTTSTDGQFTITSLRPTGYSLSVAAEGFRTANQTALTLEADQIATVNFRMQLGQTSESIEISADAIQVDTSTSTLRQVVDEKRISDLPLNGRNAAQLTLLVAGAILRRMPARTRDMTKTFPGAVTASTNGSRANNMSFRLDGGNNVDEYTNVNAPFPFPDALQEFSVQTSNYSAEFGQNSGGVVNIVTKSGTNNCTATLFGFLRNNVFNARNFFSAKVDQLEASPIRRHHRRPRGHSPGLQRQGQDVLLLRLPGHHAAQSARQLQRLRAHAGESDRRLLRPCLPPTIPRIPLRKVTSHHRSAHQPAVHRQTRSRLPASIRPH